MKKLYFLLYSSFSVLGFSQTILNQSESATRTVQDPNLVVLAPGFHATSAVSNPFVAKIGASSDTSGGGPSTPSTAGSGNPSGTTDTPTNRFHDTQGNIEVNGGGQLQFTLPIALPPGVKSVAPQINLVYTSGSGNGIAGYGWNISGITAIARMGKTIEKDGQVKGIRLDYSDYYSFNGQRLIYKSGGRGPGYDGADGSIYTTENYSNIKVKAVGSIAGQEWKGPEFWEVTFEDGSQAWYGSTPDGSYVSARTPVEYNIVKWKDAQGNYINYSYTQTNNVAVISNIHWGGNETLGKGHFNEIQFIYTGRNLNEVSYINGISFIQQRILTSIVVNTNGNQFKKYIVQYDDAIKVDNDPAKIVNYQFVKNIKEFNANDEEANPITFSTKPLTTSFQEKPFINFESVYLTGDYDGDGLVDFILKESAQAGKPEGYYLYFDKLNNASPKFLYLGPTSSLPNLTNFTVKPTNNIIKPQQGLVTLKNIYDSSNPQSNSGIEIKCFSINLDTSLLNTLNNPLILEKSNIIQASAYQAPYYTNFPPANYGNYIESTALTPKEIDINLDGIPELVFTIFDKGHYKRQQPAPYEWMSVDLGYRYIIVDYDDFTNNSSVFTKINTPTSTNILESASVMDFDNDRIQDIIKIEFPNYNNYATTNVSFFTKNKYSNTIVQRTVNTPITVVSQYSIIRNGSGNNKYMLQLKQKHSIKGIRNEIKFADLNGDGNIEILAPLEKNKSNDEHIAGWSFYLNNGKTLSEFCQGFVEYYDSNPISNGYYQKSQNGVIDMDNDGKSDILQFYTGYNTQQSGNYSNSGLFKMSEFKYDLNNTQLKWSWQINTLFFNHRGGTSLSPIFGDFRINNNVFKVIFLSQSLTNDNDKKLFSYQHYNLGNSKSINTITQGGIYTEIEYKELDPTVNPSLYAPLKKEQYPFMELDKISQSYAVSQLRQVMPDNTMRKQDFRYRGFITHLQGKGMVGFRQTARSSWYTDNLVNTKVWSGAEIDPLNDGIPIKEWSIKTNDENQIFPTDISENNTQLLSFRSTEYRFDKLSNNKVSATVPIKSITKDFMQDIRTESSIQYDAYYLPITTTSNTNNGFAISTTNLHYFPPNLSGIGKDYYVGRLQSKIEQMQVYGDTKGSKEEYTYENNLLKTLKTWNRDNTGWLNEEYTYDDFGNITQKVITSSIDGNSKTDKAEYDAKGRFVIKKTDNLGLDTNMTYNDWGQVLTQTDPLGNVLTNEYDDWGKLLKCKTNLGGTTTYEYKKESNGDAVVSEHAPDGTEKISYTNKLGQNYLSKARKFGQGQYVSVMTYFDGLGRKIWESEPYSGEYPNLVNSIEYDDYSRPVRAIAFTGKVVENTYNGRTATATETNANNRFKKQTADPIGNIISTEDLGGVINFKFNAAGENTEANYEGNIVKTSYDVWGNKVRFEDPSNGVYEYQYNGYMGAISKTKSPKGEKTYEYNNLGQLTTQKEKSTTGNTTDKTINFSYNSKGMIVQKSGTSLGKFFGSGITYDDYGRVLSSYEDSNGKYFMKKGITYDDKMRVTSYEKSLYSSGILTKVSIENEYDTWSGELYRVKEKGTGKILWQLNEVNAKGQVTQAKLGNVTINNTYATNGFLNNVNHTNTTGNTILQIGYSFNAIKNELNSRTTGGDFNIIEQFEYDSNNRLANWTDPVNGVFTQNQKRNVYDNKGRITQNDQVGTFSFSTRKLYQPVGITLNAEGTNNYNNDLLQKITYNENNDPVFIDGLKGDVAFEYGLTSMRQKVTYGGNFAESAEGKFTKYYSEDGSYEIIKNNQTGEEKHLIYIGGSPYESNIIYLKEFSTDNAKFVFLHKDYLGSILAITDEAGTKLEQRHFDAWGNLTHLKIGNKAIITDKEKIRNYLSDGNLVVDRGYTSHEHFAEVGLIHMNGRLYDPLLRRFLNADENIQDPHNTQNYNKYGYVMNNPLMYNDPNGEFFMFLGLGVLFWKAVIIGAAVGLASYTVGLAVTGNLDKWNIGGALKATFFGALGGAASFGVGSIFSAAGEAGKAALTAIGQALDKSIGGFGLAVVQAGTHAISQGVLGLMQGGDFLSSAVAGFAGSLGASGWSSIMGTSGGAMIAFGALSGGIGAELTGGNFWQGAITGGIVAGLNHEMHKMSGFDNGKDPRKPLRSKRLISKSQNHSLSKGSRGGQSVITRENPTNQVGNGKGMFVPTGSQSMTTSDLTYYDDGTVDVNMTTQVAKMNTTGSYIANYDIVGPNGNIIDAGFLVNKGFGINARMDYRVYTTQGSAAVLSTAKFTVPLNSVIRVNVGLTYKIPAGATGAITTTHIIRVR